MVDLLVDRSLAQWKAVFESEAFEGGCCYDGDDLGAWYTPEGTGFKVWAPTAGAVTLNLYADGNAQGKAELPLRELNKVELPLREQNKAELPLREQNKVELPMREYEMHRGDNGVFELFVPGDLDGVYYTYTVTVGGVSRETQDIYGRACGVNGRRSMVINLERTNPEGWSRDGLSLRQGAPVIIYELHVKDFSDDPGCGVPQRWRGKYLAFTAEHTVLNGHEDFATGIDYLKSLGVTHVHLLPVFDFGSVDESGALPEAFNWGYDPVNYNVPEGSYATDPLDGAVRIREFKAMVKALHDAGLGVIMDVVYNHTYSMDSAFERTVPGYYYRADESGVFSNGSCCGNDTASERRMFRKFMVDSVCYWAVEYHIDGFRFDLMGLHDTKTMNEVRKALDALPGKRNILLYGEPWSAGKTAMRQGARPALKKNIHLLDEGIAVFNDDTRDTIKGSVFFEDEGGFVNGHPEYAAAIKSCVMAWCDGHGGYRPANPGQMISYTSAHDNFTLWDKLVYTAGDGIYFHHKDERLLQMNRMAAGIVFTCLGHVFFQAGEEFARSKSGVGDSYNKPPKINRLDWQRAFEYRGLTDYYKGLITLRKSFGGFCDYDENSVRRVRFVPQKSPDMVSFILDGQKNERRWQQLFVIYNPTGENQQAEFPEDEDSMVCSWRLISDGMHVWNEGRTVSGDEYLWTAPLSVTIFGRPAG